MSTLLGIKLLLVPALIGAVTLAGRRWGPAVAGWLSGFPIVAGPILFFITIEHGPVFGAAAAAGTLLGIPAVFLFNLAYAWTATRRHWPLSLLAALAAYACGATALVSLRPGAAFSAAVIAAVLLLGARLFPRSGVTALPPPSKSKANAEVGYRMLAAAALVVLVTHFSSTLGPRLSGLFAMFPVISIVLASFSHHHAGAAFATHLLKGVIFGWYALATFCLLLAWLLPAQGTVPGFSLAIGGALLVQLLTRLSITRPRS